MVTKKKFEFYAVEQTFIDRSSRGLRFFGRDEQKNKVDFVIEGTRPYFFILPEEQHKVDFPCIQTGGYTSMYGEDLIKLTYENPWDLYGNIKKGFAGFKQRFIKPYEADIPYPTRFLIDSDIFSTAEVQFDDTGKAVTITPVEANVSPRIMNVDIETEYYGGSNKDMMQPIICIGFHDSYTNKMYSLSVRPDGQTGTKQYNITTKELKTNFEVEEIWCKNETDVLNLFKQYVKEFDIDIFTGWNVHFDMVYIAHRFDVLNIGKEELSPIGRVKDVWQKPSSDEVIEERQRETNMMIRGRAIIDLLKGYKRIKWKQIASFRLDAIAQNEFGSGKVDYRGWMGDFWKNDFDKFIRYNLRDIEISVAIDVKYSITDSLLGIRRMSGCELSDILWNSKIIDVYILRYCKNKFVLPSKKKREGTFNKKGGYKKIPSGVEGGFVLEPVQGIKKNVAVLDLKALYPSIMLAFNMSPETVADRGPIAVGNGTTFRKETGILKDILLDLGKKRDELRAMLKTQEVKNDPQKYANIYKRQYYFKTFTNSLYGVTLYDGFRLHNKSIGAAITYIGRYLAGKIKELSDSMGYTVIRQDTDSAFVDFNESDSVKAVAIGKELEKKINASYGVWFKEHNCDISYFDIKFEKMYGIMFSGAEKKLYAGKIIWDWETKENNGFLEKPEIEIKGFATVKSDRSQFSKKLQKHLFEMLFAEATAQEVYRFICNETDKFYKKQYSYEEIGIPKAISRDLEDYKIKNPWVKGVEFSLANIKGFTFQPKPSLLYIKKCEKYPTEHFCFNTEDDVPNDIQLDMLAMMEKCIYNVVKNQLTIIGLNADDLYYYIVNKTKNQSFLSQYK